MPDLNPADGPIANLSVTKTVSPATAQPGQPLHYRIVVVNHGPDAAENVVVAELSHGTNPLHIRSSKGKCYGQHPARCQIRRIPVSGRVVINVTVTRNGIGRHTNRVGVVSSTDDPNLANNVASATVIVRQPPAPIVTG